MRIVHFGIGSLGLGLVVPLLRPHAAELTVIDQNIELVAALNRAGHYSLQIHDEDGTEKQSIVIERGLDLGREEHVIDALRSADIVTTSVLKDNLKSVARYFTSAFGQGGKACPRVIACENLERSSEVLADHIRVGGDWRPLFHNTEVDRICQTMFPDTLGVRTERYLEWKIETSPPYFLVPNSGLEFVEDIEPYFVRKRLFVNTIADYMGFAGSMFGHLYLHEAALDPHILEHVYQLHEELIALFCRQHAFTSVEVRQYAQDAVIRLQQSWINRRIETVARGHLTKLSVDERFVKPYLAYIQEFGTIPYALKSAIKAVVRSGHVSLTELQQFWHGYPELESMIQDQQQHD